MSVEIDIARENGDWPDACESVILKTVYAVLDSVHFEADTELSVVLADDAFIQDLNKNYRGKDKATNVLSFPQDEDFMLGDVVFAFETVAYEAEVQGKSFMDHFTHLIVHGVLHLLGHDHEDDSEADIMESLEIKILASLGVKNPYMDANSVA